MSDSTNTIETFANQEYKWGFVTDIEADAIPRGLNEDVIRLISAKKQEPEWLLEWRLKAFRHWQTMKEPTWANIHYPPIDYQDIIYYSSPKSKKSGPKSLDEVDPELLKTYAKLGIPLKEQELLAGVAVDAVFDSVSVATTFKEKLKAMGIIFGSFSEAVREHPDLVRQYLGSVVPSSDNFFAALNSAVFSDGSFCYVPKGVRCPMELSTYFRINAKDTGQFERTLIVADEGAYVSYLEGCTAPMRDTNQLHAAVVELVALDNAQIKYSTVQNWYPGDKEGKGGIYNFVTKRGACRGVNSKISWTQVETGSAITWKYPSCLLMGDNSVGEFYSVALTNNWQQADTGTKMIHIGKNTTSHHRFQGHLRRPRPEHLSRRRQDSEVRHRRPQLLAVRFAAAGRQMRRPHLPLSRSQEHLFAGGARGLHLENRRRPDFLLPPARHLQRRRGLHDRARFLQAGLPRAAHGIRRGSAEAAGSQSRRKRRITNGSIRNQRSARHRWRSRNSEGHLAHHQFRRGPRHHGAQRLRQKHAGAGAGGARSVRRHRRPGRLRRQGPAGHVARRPRARGHLSGVPISRRDPRRQQHVLPESRPECHPQAPRPRRTGRHGLPRPGSGPNEAPRNGPGTVEPRRQHRFLRRREEAQRDFPNGRARAQAWPFSTKPIPASISTPCAPWRPA